MDVISAQNSNCAPSGGVMTLPPWPCDILRQVRVVLASNSPRRRQLLGMILPSFEIAVPRDIDERYPSDMPADGVPAFLSQLKADAYAGSLQPGELLITADTVVICHGEILGKPADEAMACDMLRRLRNNTHTVVTGVTMRSPDGKKNDTFSESTRVTFGDVGDDEISRYVDIFRPLDKAGAYGIQEWIGAAAITGIDGCFYNVMGLPLHRLYRHLKDFYSA